MSGIKSVAFTDLLSTIVDNRGRTCPTAAYGTPLIATNCIKDDQLYPVFENIRYVSDETYSKWFRGHPEPNDILFVCKGSPGRVALVPDPVEFCIAQDMVSVRANTSVVNPRYLYYVLKLGSTRDKIAGMNVGTMIPHFKKGDFGKLKLSVHTSLSTQQAIAEVLSALDDKIATNSKLTPMLLAITDLEFDRLTRSADRHEPLGRLVHVTKGVSYKSADLVDGDSALVTLKSFTRKGLYSARGLKPYAGPFKSAQVVRSGEIIVAQTDLTQAADIVGRSVMVQDHESFDRLVASLDVAIVRPSGDTPTEFILGVTRDPRFRHHCRGHARGTTVLHLAPNSIETYQAPALEIEQQREFASVAAPLYSRAALAEAENRTLAATRDALLPQLMSGKLRVKDAEALVANAV